MKFLKYFCAASLLAASAGTLWSCDDDDDKRLSDAVLASVSSLTFEAQDTSEKIITVYADADWVTEIPDWVTVTPTEGTGVMDVTVSVSENMRDGAMDNPRKAKLVFKGRTLASRAEVLVSQVGNKFRDIPEYQKIGDVIALDDEAAVKIPSALVMAVTNKGFIISDDQQSGAIFVEDTEKVAVGDKVCVWGTKSSDGAKLPIISCAEKSDDPNREGDKVEVLSSGATVSLLISASRRSPSSAVCAMTKNRVVAGKRAEHVGQLRSIDSCGNTRSRTGLCLDHNQIIGAQYAGNQLGNHALQMQVLGKDIDALGKLTQSHVRDITRNGRLRAIETHGAKLVYQNALRADVLIAHNISDGILAPIAFFGHTKPSLQKMAETIT